MKLQINGEPREFSDVSPSFTLAALVEKLGMKADRVAVELNRDIAPRERWSQTLLKDGDQLEIVHFVGGGSYSRSSVEEFRPDGSLARPGDEGKGGPGDRCPILRCIPRALFRDGDRYVPGKRDTVIDRPIHFTTTDPSVLLPTLYQFTPADQGQHTFNNLMLVTPGIQTVTVSDYDATPVAGLVNIMVTAK